MPDWSRFVAALRHAMDGTVADAPALLDALSHDFGGLVRRRPGVVVRPADTRDVAAVVRLARDAGVPVTTRGAGHSLSGQSLSDGGVLLDMRSLHRVHAVNAEDGWFEADPGVVWHTLVAETLRHGLVPPVLTGTLRTTVGGTHSVGGMGPASFRHGTQADNCLALEVVTGDGEVRWCSPHEEPELFAHVPCSLGRLGVITRVRGRLRPAPNVVRHYSLLYASRTRLLADLQRAALHPLAASVAAYGTPYGTPYAGRWLYTADVGMECDADSPPGDALLDTLHPDRVQAVDTRPFAAQVMRYEELGAGEPRNHASPGANPWVDALLPNHAVEPYFRDVMKRLPSALLAQCTLLMWPVAGARLTRPLFRAPRGDALTLASIFPTLTAGTLGPAAARMTEISELATAYGGTRYLYGWVALDADGWAAHYGPHWPSLQRLVARYDPDGIINPGFIPLAAPAMA